MSTPIETVIERAKLVLEGQTVPARKERFRSYAVSNFRGGIGKSTLSFEDLVAMMDAVAPKPGRPKTYKKREAA